MKHVLWTASCLVLAGASLAACGDDDNGASDDAAAEMAGEMAGGAGVSTPDSDMAAASDGEQDADGDDETSGASEDTEDSGPVDGANTEDGDDSGDSGDGDEDAEAENADAPTFGAISEVANTLVTTANDLRAVTYAADGSIYAAGYSDGTAEDRQTVVLRFTADGELDTTFGVDGVVTHNLVVDGDEGAAGIVELAGGDLVLAVNHSDEHGGAEMIADVAGGEPLPRPDGQDVSLVRLDNKGALVTDFGVGGILTLTFGWPSEQDSQWPTPTFDSGAEAREQWSTTGFPSDTAFDLQVDASAENERLVIFGFGPAPYGAESAAQRYDNDRYILRVLADGATDTSFNADGSPYVFNTFAELSDNARHGLVEDDGAIVSSGYTNFGDGLGNHVVLIRLLPDGTPDAGFGFGFEPDQEAPGVTKFNPFLADGGMAEAYGVAKQSSGLYVTTGYGRATGADLPSSLGYATTDSVDLVSFGVNETDLTENFGSDGVTAIQSEELALPSGTEERGRAIVMLPDDRAIHAGRFANTAALYVTLPDGQLDTAQGEDGVLMYPDDALTTHFYNVALSQDGTRVAATTYADEAGARLVVLEVAGD